MVELEKETVNSKLKLYIFNSDRIQCNVVNTFTTSNQFIGEVVHRPIIIMRSRIVRFGNFSESNCLKWFSTILVSTTIGLHITSPVASRKL